MVKVKNNFPKFYICKYGAFYEGERLSQYCRSGKSHYYYVADVIIDKFLIHYIDYKPVMYFKFHEVDKKQTWTLPVEGYLGILYRKDRRKY